MPSAPPAASDVDTLIDSVFGAGAAAAADGGAELMARDGDGGAGAGSAGAGPSTSDGSTSGAGRAGRAAGMHRLARSAPPSTWALDRRDDSKRAEEEAQRLQEAQLQRLREARELQLRKISSAESASRDALATFAAAAAAQEAHADFISAQMDLLIARRSSRAGKAALRWYSSAKASLAVRGGAPSFPGAGAAPRSFRGPPQPLSERPAWGAVPSFRRMPSVREKGLEEAGKEGEKAPKMAAAVTAAAKAAVSSRSVSRSVSGQLAPDKKAPPLKRSSSSLAKVSPSPDKAKAPRSAASTAQPPSRSASLGAGDGDGGSAALRRMASVREEERAEPRPATPPTTKAPCAVM